MDRIEESPRVRLLHVALIASTHLALAVRFLLDDSPGTTAALTGFPLDDAWIHLVYGREIATTGLPAYNPGEPEAGFSSPLWMMAAATAEALHVLLGVSSVLVLKAFGIASGLATSLAVRRLGLSLSGNSWAALAAALLAALAPAMAFTQVSGMEPGLAAALAAFSIHALLAGRPLRAGILGALAYLSRPETAVVTATCASAVILQGLIQDRLREAFLRAALVTLPGAAVAGIWAAYCLAVTGHPLPNTFYVKATSADLGTGFSTILREIVAAQPAGLAGAVLYLGGALRLLLRRRDAAAWALVLCPWVFLFSVAASRPMPAGHGGYYYWLRYVVPALPLLFPPLACALEWLSTRALPGGTRIPPTWRRMAGPTIATALTVAALAGYPSALDAQAGRFSWNCQNIDEMQVAIGHWVRDRVPPDRAVVTIDAGAIRYFGGRRTLDLLGLNSREVAFDPALAAVRDDPRVTAQWMDRAGADVLIVFPSLTRLLFRPEAPTLFGLVETFRSPRYTVVPAPQDVMAIFARRRDLDPSSP